MPDLVKPRRAYDSPHRREQARATRHTVLEAARVLFTENGYVATTIDAIATRANVAPETVYAVFGTKRALLSELVDISIAGGDLALPILDQPWVQEMREAPDLRRRIQILAGNGRSILERRAAVDDVVRGAAAADPEIATLWERGKAERHAGQLAMLRIVMGAAGPPAIGFETAADILFALGSPETYRLLVVDRGWTGARFEHWYGETIERLVLDQISPGPRTDGG